MNTAQMITFFNDAVGKTEEEFSIRKNELPFKTSFVHTEGVDITTPNGPHRRIRVRLSNGPGIVAVIASGIVERIDDAKLHDFSRYY